MTNIHINMDEEIRELLSRRENDIVFRAVVLGDPAAHAKLKQERSTVLSVNVSRDIPFETRQVESFLRFMDERLEVDMELAEMDNVVYDGLGEHRILGKKKRKKKKRSY